MKRTTRTHTPGERRAWGWVAHLRAGGTTPWADWRGEAESVAGHVEEHVEGQGRILPGAQQLELLRRLNEVAAVSSELTERILTASAPGRGRPDLELTGAADVSPFGPPPIDPAELPDDELIRVATTLIADDLVSSGVPRPRVPRRVRLWRTRYRIVGDPWLADPIRSELVARGRPPGGRGSVVLVMGRQLDTMLVDAWTSRAFAEGGPSWPEWLDSTVTRDRVPPRIDLVQAAHAWSARVGSERVRIVLDPAAVPKLVGVRRALSGVATIGSPVPSDSADLARRVAAVLGLLVVGDQRGELLRETLLPRLLEAGGDLPVVPPRHAQWVHRRAVRMRDDLLRAGYAVHGDPDTLVPPEAGRRTDAPAPSAAGVLGLAMRWLQQADRIDDIDEGRRS